MNFLQLKKNITLKKESVRKPDLGNLEFIT